MASDKEDLEYGLGLVAAGHIKPILDRAASVERGRRGTPFDRR